MAVQIALFRGINLGNYNKVKMAELKAMFETMGFSDVETYIQSGNVLFESNEHPDLLAEQIERHFESQFGFSVPVILRTPGELQNVLRNCPFPPHEWAEGEQVYISFMQTEANEKKIDAIQTYTNGIDDFRILNREVYILYRQSSHKSTLSNQFFEKKLGVTATNRNWNTVTRLSELGLGRMNEM